MVVEVMGRNTGWIALAAGMSGGADVILVPEAPTPIEEVCDRLRRHELGRGFSIVVVAEGYPLTRRAPASRSEPIGLDVDRVRAPRRHRAGRRRRDHEGDRVRDARHVLGHTQRGGTPTARDRFLATRLGLKAVELAVSGWGRMAAVSGNDVVDVALEEAVRERQAVPASWIAAGGASRSATAR